MPQIQPLSYTHNFMPGRSPLAGADEPEPPNENDANMMTAALGGMIAGAVASNLLTPEPEFRAAAPPDPVLVPEGDVAPHSCAKKTGAMPQKVRQISFASPRPRPRLQTGRVWRRKAGLAQTGRRFMIHLTGWMRMRRRRLRSHFCKSGSAQRREAFCPYCPPRPPQMCCDS